MATRTPGEISPDMTFAELGIETFEQLEMLLVELDTLFAAVSFETKQALMAR